MKEYPVDKAHRALGKLTEEIIDEAIDEMHKRIVRRTPVDSGRARESWKRDKDDIISNVEYMGVLEYGHSEKAPHGMVRVTAKEAEQITKQIANKKQ